MFVEKDIKPLQHYEGEKIIIVINYLIENNTLMLDKNKVIKNKGQI